MRVTLHEFQRLRSAPEPLKRFLTLSSVIDHWGWIIYGKRFVPTMRKLRGIDISKLRYPCLDINTRHPDRTFWFASKDFGFGNKAPHLRRSQRTLPATVVGSDVAIDRK